MDKTRLEYDMERTVTYLPFLRKCAGLSAEALASKIGLTKQGISYIETHPEAKFGRLQYIGIRLAFEDEIRKNRENINLIDCYDLVYSDPKFYEENRARIEYAMHQAVEDTKIQKRKNRAMQKEKKNLKNEDRFSISSDIGIASGSSLAGATAATMAIGGVASATFPLFFPLVAVGAAVVGAAAIKMSKKDGNKNEKDKEQSLLQCNRASNTIFSAEYSPWLMEALN